MATIRRFLSPIVTGGLSEIVLRISVKRGKVWKIKSGIHIDPSRMKDDGSIIIPRANQVEAAALRKVQGEVEQLEQHLYAYLLHSDQNAVERVDVAREIDRYHHPERYGDGAGRRPLPFFGLMEEFLKVREMSKNRIDGYRSLARTLHRFEMHRRATGEPEYTLDVDTMTAADLMRFEAFYRDEWKLYDKYPDIYTAYPAELRPQHKTHRPARRGENIVVGVMRKLRAFFNWLSAQEYTANRPFAKYEGKPERYGTPYYLTIAERDRVADYDLSSFPALAVQRDIFIFQCLVGCRVSDLRRLRSSSIVDGAVEYVAAKTAKERQDVVRVPLGSRGRALVERYAGQPDGRLFPFISDQRYNDAIKEICRRCGIERMVTVINPKTGKDERRHIYEVASSHMARRTFIGNLYKKVKDPNLVSSLSGHKEGSRAFARYREIDDDIKKELIDLID